MQTFVCIHGGQIWSNRWSNSDLTVEIRSGKLMKVRCREIGRNPVCSCCSSMTLQVKIFPLVVKCFYCPADSSHMVAEELPKCISQARVWIPVVLHECFLANPSLPAHGTWLFLHICLVLPGERKKKSVSARLRTNAHPYVIWSKGTPPPCLGAHLLNIKCSLIEMHVLAGIMNSRKNKTNERENTRENAHRLNATWLELFKSNRTRCGL